MTKTIKVEDNVWQEITNVKTELMHKTYNHTIQYLLFEADNLKGWQGGKTPDSQSIQAVINLLDKEFGTAVEEDEAIMLDKKDFEHLKDSIKKLEVANGIQK